jgi:DNA topoisomerase-1
MEVRHGRFGAFYGCTRFREDGCKGIINPPSAAICPCPGCESGNIIEKRSRKGRTFFACDRYPDCDFALWHRPTGEKCPQCGSLLVERRRRDGEAFIACSQKGCDGGGDGKSD